MTEEPVPAVRIFNREDFNIEATRLVVEVYPSPDQKYFGHWYMELPYDDNDDINLDEIYALQESTLAASRQIESLLQMIEDQEDDDE
jgi:hypothetical protein